jgi:UDP:flavonoid glycosyltransferase YjiC (YdhE family)
MARVLMCWELGNGLAYLESQAAHGRALRKAGHEVLFASRELRHAERLLGKDFTYYQAPTQVIPEELQLAVPMTFADILQNLGYNSARGVSARVQAWRNLLDLLKPDVVRCANSPATLLAARGTGIRTIATGIGFTHPPAVSPLPNLRSWDPKAVPERMAEREAKVLDAMNHALEGIDAPRVAGVGALYNEADVRELYTYPELDDYGPRDTVKYLGNFQVASGETPAWPDVPGKRIFAYLEPSKAVAPALQSLIDSGQPVLLYMPHAPEGLLSRSGDNLRIVDRPLDLNRATTQCDIGVSHGGHNIVGSLMQAGKPQLCLYRGLPERLTALKVTGLGVGLMSGLHIGETQDALPRLLREPGFTEKARELGRRLARYTVDAALQDTVETVENLVKP